MTSSCLDGAAADEAIPTADAVIVTGYGHLDAGRVASLERAVGILCYSIGMDKVDGQAAKEAGIPVRNVPDYCTDEVSDHASPSCLRRNAGSCRSRRRRPPAAGRTTIARSPARSVGSAARPWGSPGPAGSAGWWPPRPARSGFRTIAYDPFIDRRVDPDLPLVDRDELFATSDAIVVCAAYTPVPRRSSRARCWPASSGASSSSTSRAAATSTSRRSPRHCGDGRVAVAALDVRVTEPPDPADDPLSGLPNVVLTPHIAGSSLEAVEDLHRLAAEYVLDLLEAGGRISVAA